TNQATPLPAERLQGRGAAPALALLKALLGCPDRFASRDWLLEQLWPDSPSRSAKERLDDVASILRGLLRPVGNQAKILHYVYGSDGKGAGYRLDAYPSLWCDADAFVWYVEHATLLDRLGKDSIACWERAYLLASRGMYLPEHLYEDWARRRRETFEGLLRDCVQRWSHLLRHTGHGDEAILRLRTYWEERPTEEDALRPLLELLGESERYQEAEGCYAKAAAALKEDGFVPDARTREMLESVRALQIQREPQLSTTKQHVRSHNALFSLSENAMRSSCSQGVPRNIIEGAHILERDIVDQLRRQLLKQTLYGTGGVLLASQNLGLGLDLAEQLAQVLTRPPDLAGQGGLLHHEEILSIYTVNIPIYWRLFFDGHIAEVKSVLPECLSRLSALAEQPSSHQEQAAHLASKASQLSCMLALQDQNFGNAVVSAQRGFQYGQLAGDPNLQVASLIRKALVYFYLKRPEQKLQAYEKALQYEMLVSPLLRGRVYMGLVEAHGNFGHEYEAKHFLDLCHKALPTFAKDDPSFAYTHFSGYSRNYEGLLYLDLHQPQKAWEILAPLDQALPLGITFERVEFSVRQTKILIALEDLKQSCVSIETSISSAVSLGSHLRCEETRDLYYQMQAKWPNERQVQELADLFLG
ncbi:MAG: BTAD domain-containing putative transcriptional regulator, partial [Ktedonobacteraceae bacterium]